MGIARHPPSIDPVVGLVFPDDLEAELRAELDALARLDGVDGVAPDFVRFCERVARAQATTRARIRAATPAGTAGSGNAPGPHGLLAPDTAFDPDLLAELLGTLARGAAAVSPIPDQLARLGEAAERDPALLARLARAAVFDDAAPTLQRLARRSGVPVPALAFVGRLLAAPFAAEARGRRGPIPERDARHVETPEAGRCPACASAPALALLCRDDGRRRLLCGLCGETWIAPRLLCVACGTRDQSRLGMLYRHETDARWVEICDGCRRYLKTLDQRRLPDGAPVVLRAEEARTLDLDLMAEEAGYTRSDCHPSLLLETTT